MKTTCSVADCEKPSSSRGWCKTHHSRWLRTGDVGASLPIATKGVHYECAVDGCARRGRSKGYCHAHYSRWTRTDDPGPAEVWDKSRHVDCSVDECARIATSNGLCGMHYLRWYRHGDTVDRDNHKSNHTRWLDRETLNYDAAHDRIKRYRGAASTHVCKCGSQAEDWAYLHTEAKPLRDERGRPFSDNIEAYAAMCRSCHKAFDWTIKRERVLKMETEVAS